MFSKTMRFKLRAKLAVTIECLPISHSGCDNDVAIATSIVSLVLRHQ
jgi:hypothetical protein